MSKKVFYNYLEQSNMFDEKLLKIPLAECREPFISIHDLWKRKNIPIILPEQAKEKILYVRNSVGYALLQAAVNVWKSGYILRLEDAYRSLSQQRIKFLKELSRINKTFPYLSTEESLKITNMFVAGIPIFAAHTAGAAVDVTLVPQSEQDIDMGCPYLTFSEISVTEYANISRKVQDNRTLLVNAMTQAGFINYPFEYWHYSIGDVCATFIRGDLQAIYGPVQFDQRSNTISFPLGIDEIYRYFNSARGM